MKDWKVRGISEQTIEKIRQAAKDSNLSIGEYLNSAFGVSEAKVESGYRSWTINKIKGDTISKLKQGAMSQGLTVGKYLKLLVDDVGKMQSTYEEKLDRIRGIVNE